MNTAVHPHVNLYAFPAFELEALCRAALDAAKRFYADPANEAKYRAYLAEQGRYEDEDGRVRVSDPEKFEAWLEANGKYVDEAGLTRTLPKEEAVDGC